MGEQKVADFLFGTDIAVFVFAIDYTVVGQVFGEDFRSHRAGNGLMLRIVFGEVILRIFLFISLLYKCGDVCYAERKEKNAIGTGEFDAVEFEIDEPGEKRIQFSGFFFSQEFRSPVNERRIRIPVADDEIVIGDEFLEFGFVGEPVEGIEGAGYVGVHVLQVAEFPAQKLADEHCRPRTVHGEGNSGDRKAAALERF